MRNYIVFISCSCFDGDGALGAHLRAGVTPVHVMHMYARLKSDRLGAAHQLDINVRNYSP